MIKGKQKIQQRLTPAIEICSRFIAPDDFEESQRNMDLQSDLLLRDSLVQKPKMNTVWRLPQPGAREKAQGMPF
jgi:hypothetical protein